MTNRRGKKHAMSSIETLGDGNIININNGGDDDRVWDVDDDEEDSRQPSGELEASAATNIAIPTTRSSRVTASQRTCQQPQKQKKNSPLSDPRLLQAIEEARYEAFVDPYRGLAPFFWVSDIADYSAAASNSNDDGDDANGKSMILMMQDSDDEESDRWWEMTNIDPENMKNPWAKCASVLDNDCRNRWSFQNWEAFHGVVNVDDEDEFYDTDDLRRNNVDFEQTPLLVQCGCPTVDKLAADAFEADHKLHNNKRKKAGSRGQKRMKKDAEVSLTKSSDDNKDNLPSTPILRRLICGERSPGAIPHHPCDYNPYCLASLGGIMDHYRHSVAKISYAIKTKQKPNCGISQQIYDDLLATLKLHSSQRENAIGDDKPIDDGILRGSSLVDIEKIKDHASLFIADDDIAITEYIEQIKLFNRTLIFPPHDELLEEGDSKLRLSAPPGLHNLGATCYLNSQLQCLAQNLGFVRSLFSWIASDLDAENRMSKIISCMQSILVRMRYGPDRVIYTHDFAAALNLENGEMQDPNEFARLLFDRMAESFRRSAIAAHGSEQSGLGDLLPSVFGGRINYITKCVICGLESTRSEDFMELSIPIADCRHEGSTTIKTGNITANNAAASSDIDVQHCVNSYLYPESLDGDNQYDCSKCNQKRDAIRSMAFSKLPPVLNIQLARYVFDRETLSKRKLTTKVLLPLSLEIPNKGTMRSDNFSNYILCAVQNHLGISAHGGHYVANVMDWTTGVWYEVNDENVSILEDGPGSSFDPNNVVGKNGVSQKKVSGSQDAYSLLYVERRYLAQQCKTEMWHVNDNETISESVVDTNCTIMAAINAQRSERYKMEFELAAKKKLQDRRVNARQQQLLEVFKASSQLFDFNTHGFKYVWVDSNFLRRLFSCHDDLDDIFEVAAKSISALSPCLCEHRRLHPRVARGGKLLPIAVYDELDAIMTRMYSMYLRDQGLDSLSTHHFNLSDYVFIDGDNLTCKDCGVSYQHETKRKLDVFTTLLSIYDDLLPGRNDLDQSDILDSSVYAISRTWVTTVRKYVEKIVNELNKKSSYESCGGVDLLDLRAVTDTNETLSFFNGEDPTSKISCQHERCSSMHNRQSVRLISKTVWNNIIKIFPLAIPHVFERKNDIAIGNCVQCFLSKEEEMIFPQKLNEWKRDISQSASLDELLRRGKASTRNYPSEIVLAMQRKPAHFILNILHHDDVQRWRDAFRVAGKSTKKNNSIIQHELGDLLFISSESDSSVREWKFRLSICEDHKMTVGIPSPSKHNDAMEWFEDLQKANFELLSVDEHTEFLSSLNLLKSILQSENETRPLPRPIMSPPTVSIQLSEEGDSIETSSHVCFTCDASTIEIDETLTSTKAHELKEDIKMDGPMCKIFVYEVENGTSIDVATSLIAVDLLEEGASTSVATGRPRRSRKCRGGRGRFPVEEIDMAFDGNLAHLRLLLHQVKGKKLHGQRLYLLRTSPSSCETTHAYEELDHASNTKAMQDIIHGSASTDDETNNISYNIIHIVLSYDDSSCEKRSTRKQSTPEENNAEEALHFSLLEIAYMGWNADDAKDKNVKDTRTKQRRQERGFQGTFLQSTDFDSSESLPEVHDGESGRCLNLIASVNSDQHKQSANDNEILQTGVENTTKSTPTSQIMSESSKAVIVLDGEDNDRSKCIDFNGAATSRVSRCASIGYTIAPHLSSLTQVEEQQDEQVHQLGDPVAMEARMISMEHQMRHNAEMLEKIWQHLKDNARNDAIKENGSIGNN